MGKLTVGAFAVSLCLVVMGVVRLTRAFAAYEESDVDLALEHVGVAVLLVALGVRGFLRDERVKDRLLDIAAVPFLVLVGAIAYRREWFTIFMCSLAGILMISFLLRRRHSRRHEEPVV